MVERKSRRVERKDDEGVAVLPLDLRVP